MKFSKHAINRGQQRGIPETHIQLLVAFGTPVKAKGGAVSYHLDKKALRQLEHLLRQGMQVLDKIRGKTVICSEDDVVITCYHTESIH